MRKNLKIEKKSDINYADEKNIERRDYFVKAALAGLLPLGRGMEKWWRMMERMASHKIADDVLRQRR